MDGLEGKSLKEIFDLGKTNREFYIKNRQQIYQYLYRHMDTIRTDGIKNYLTYEFSYLRKILIITDITGDEPVKHEFKIVDKTAFRMCVDYIYLKYLI